ncbi:GNAT family N-acetyltransferase [Frigidibacter sp. ROC022]|uniref:GNAT family N-acetyltransferase n=1 Tax=Frigidibacter sp. ROC022 TaxID=2971796 RepID=UPI00215A3133|nr:GNAT family N-acetyltransferase [Frigidibacter sp. ROC022]MCR8726072.1 GNAT family N-acetyltransferase [Frigidibacter sp. ROC022]
MNGPGNSRVQGSRIAAENPLGADLALLHRRHTDEMHADTPPESIHMLPASALAAPGISFFVARDGEGTPVAMGALKRLDVVHAEIKSMHVLAEHRGKGLARLMLMRLIDEARAAGFTRVSLETGSQESFKPARALYLRSGFTECGPFASYTHDPNSVYMTCTLAMTTESA